MNAEFIYMKDERGKEHLKNVKYIIAAEFYSGSHSKTLKIDVDTCKDLGRDSVIILSGDEAVRVWDILSRGIVK